MANVHDVRPRDPRGPDGFSMIELVIVLALMALVLGMSALALNTIQRPLAMGMELMESQFTRVRTQAMANTTAYRVSPQSASRLVVESALSCASATWTAHPSLDLTLPERVTITGPTPLTWSVCFDTRGLASTNLTITLAHPEHGSQQIEVLLGGSLRQL